MLALFFLFPIAFMVVGSFKADTSVIADSGSLSAFVPVPFVGLENFQQAAERGNFWISFRNSAIISAGIVFGGLVVNSLLGYALARVPFRGKGLLLALVVALIIVPFETLAVPLLLIMAELRWTDTLHAQIVPFLAQPLYIFLFYSFFLGIPRELEEAARIDGAGAATVFFRIAAPLAKPAYAAAGILIFLASWGQYLWPVMVTRSIEARPLPMGIAEFQGLPPRDWGDIMAYAAMMVVPLLIVFIVFQRQFVRGVATSGSEGLSAGMLRLDDRWVWDFWIADTGADYHLFFLQAPRSLGDQVPAAPQRHGGPRGVRRPACLDTSWETPWQPGPAGLLGGHGHVDRVGAGTRWHWHLFYTGTTRTTDGAHQRIGLATSTDLSTWRSTPATRSSRRTRAGTSQVEFDAWRDPWVFRDPAGEGFHALITARATHGPADARGVIGHAWSADLLRWEVRPPLSEPGEFHHLEVPQVEVVDGTPVLLFSASVAAHRRRAVELAGPVSRQAPSWPSGSHCLVRGTSRTPGPSRCRTSTRRGSCATGQGSGRSSGSSTAASVAPSWARSAIPSRFDLLGLP